MIHVIDELKLNDFKECHCVKPKDLFARYGKRLVDASYESSEEIVPMNMNKLDSIEYLEAYDAQQADLERRRTQNESVEPHVEKRNEVSEDS